MLSRPNPADLASHFLPRGGDLSQFLPRDLSLQKKLAMDILSFRHHLDMEEEWNETVAGQYLAAHAQNQLAAVAAAAAHSQMMQNGHQARKENHSPSPMFKRKRVVKEDGSSETKWVMDQEADVMRDISTGTTSDNRPLYSCENCGKSYLWKQGLNTHKRLHCGKEPRFQCPHCPKRCYQRGNLESHIRNVHSINPITGEFIANKTSPGEKSSNASACSSPRSQVGQSPPPMFQPPPPPTSILNGVFPPPSSVNSALPPPPPSVNGALSPLHRQLPPPPTSVNGPFNLSKHFGPPAGVKATGH